MLNPYIDQIGEAKEMLGRLTDAVQELNDALSYERTVYSRMKDMQEIYECAETEAIVEAVALAALKEGPLAGLATTSKAYDLAIANLKNGLKTGSLAHLYEDLRRLKVEYEGASLRKQQAENTFTALRKASEIMAGLLAVAKL